MDRAFLRWLVLAVGGAGVAVPTPSAWAQDRAGPAGLGGRMGPGGAPAVALEAQFSQPTAERPARLFITAKIERGYHIYSITQPPGGPLATVITLGDSDLYRLAGEFQSAPLPDKKIEPLFNNLEVEEHYDRVIWHAPIELAAGTDPATVQIDGSARIQACYVDRCLPPRESPFTARLGPGVELPASAPSVSGPAPEAPPAPQPPPVAQPPVAEPPSGHGIPWVRVRTFADLDRIVEGRLDLDQLEENVRERETGSAGDEQRGLVWALKLIGLGFLGGILLNIMPCVLPVIGLKILSFVNQAGEDRFRALMLNVAFSAGLISIFLLLATLAAGMNLQWGGQFQYPWFNVTMAVVIFAMGISFLGVWEIPVPGFVGSGKAAEVTQREGLAAAFLTGIIVTLLATPCTGPFMGFAVTMVMSEPPPLIFAVFLAIGIGMASPYLLIGLFPRLIAFLPKPGAWMETFKNVMGFVLLGTAVWILTFIHWPYLVPTIGMMFGVWGACWWVQRKAVAETKEKAWAWVEAVAFAGLVWVFMFPGLHWVPRLPPPFPPLHSIGSVYEIMEQRWQLAAGGSSGASVPPGRYTLMVDFTADWCLNCKVVEATVLDTDAVRKLVEQNHVVPVQFDMTITPEDEDTKRFVRAVRAAQPSLAILPAADVNRPVTILRGLYPQGPVLEGLQKAGPSIDRPTATANRR